MASIFSILPWKSAMVLFTWSRAIFMGRRIPLPFFTIQAKPILSKADEGRRLTSREQVVTMSAFMATVLVTDTHLPLASSSPRRSCSGSGASSPRRRTGRRRIPAGTRTRPSGKNLSPSCRGTARRRSLPRISSCKARSDSTASTPPSSSSRPSLRPRPSASLNTSTSKPFSTSG